jgi:type I restriction enzyme S subunit
MNTPKIRFKGFTDDWEQRKLSELTTMHARIGWQNLRTSEFLDSGDYMLITGTDFQDGVIDYSTCHYVEKERYDQDKNIQIKNGSILITKDGTLGKVAYVQGLMMPATLNAGVFNVTIKNENIMDGKYLFQYLKAPFLMDYVSKKATGGTIKHLNQSILVDFPVAMPKREEQVKISRYFTALDNLITLHQRKCDETKQLKKFMLQKMFPKNGEKNPEIRFEGFTDDWEQRKLKNLIEEYKETVDSSCALPILTSSKTEGVILQEEHFGRKQNHDITGYNILPRNYCTYRNRSDGVDFTFNINKCCDKGIISKFYPVFCGKENDTFFISLVLNNSDEVVREIGYTCTGTGQKVLSFLDLQKMHLRVPTSNEQKKIAGFFTGLDDLITLHQRKCEKLKELKKYMLQNMFV